MTEMEKRDFTDELAEAATEAVSMGTLLELYYDNQS